MKIQIDARNFSSPLTGTTRYIYEFLTNLDLNKHRVVLALPKKINKSFLPVLKLKNITYYTSELFHPIYIYKNHFEDILWCPSHRIPYKIPSFVNCVLTVHDLIWLKFKHTMELKTYLGELFFFKKSIKRANKIICVSNSTKNDLIKYFPSCANKITTIYNGTSKKEFFLKKK